MCVPPTFLSQDEDNNPILESLWKWYGRKFQISRELVKKTKAPPSWWWAKTNGWPAISRGYHIVIDLTTTATAVLEAEAKHAIQSCSARKVVPRRWRELGLLAHHHPRSWESPAGYVHTLSCLYFLGRPYSPLCWSNRIYLTEFAWGAYFWRDQCYLHKHLWCLLNWLLSLPIPLGGYPLLPCLVILIRVAKH